MSQEPYRFGALLSSQRSQLENGERTRKRGLKSSHTSGVLHDFDYRSILLGNVVVPGHVSEGCTLASQIMPAVSISSKPGLAIGYAHILSMSAIIYTRPRSNEP